ncbi:toll/interleukin-1 receptor domain-containing protein [Stratiformator vulcanicus]|uniref:TIR domain-containing protein n=1 Tax=Stratiformator vulcanicus TaxID=2527980 RepID=A0A517R3R3_9PLAN|nr:hypothetical protein Pan189_28670 [Stratiformator vulcanicus]
MFTIPTYPRCYFDVFLSHDSEDKSWLVEELDEELRSRNVIPWFDRRDYPLAAGSPFEALKLKICECRMVVYLITEASLNRVPHRGWQLVERAYGEALSTTLWIGGAATQHVELGLFFLPAYDPRITGTPWHNLLNVTNATAVFAPETDFVAWSADRIESFLDGQANHSNPALQRLKNDPALNIFVQGSPGLEARLRCQFP